jgi:alkane 1-monooxygenase
MLAVGRYSLAYIYALTVWGAIVWRGPWVLLPAAFSFVLVPIVDALAGVSGWNPSAADEAALQADARYRWITWAWLPVGVGMTLWALVASLAPGWSPAERLGLAFGVGLMNGAAGIVYAHELVHQSRRFEPLLGEAMLMLVSYPHFRVEHVFGHHRYVATPRDPATARYGEHFYAFLLRSVFGQIVSAWHLEAARLRRAGRAATGNRLVAYAIVLAAIYAALLVFTGWRGAGFFALQSFIAFATLEVINYLEHYGLMRREIAPGRYETVRPHHSWNSSHRVSNWILINLARHSDHHAAASRRYQILRTFDDAQAPALPAGYAVMYLLALVPPLWFRVMNPRVRAWRERHA